MFSFFSGESEWSAASMILTDRCSTKRPLSSLDHSTTATKRLKTNSSATSLSSSSLKDEPVDPALSPMVAIHSLKEEPADTAAADADQSFFSPSSSSVERVACKNQPNGCPRMAAPNKLILHQHICTFPSPKSKYSATKEVRKLSVTSFLGVNRATDENYIAFNNSFNNPSFGGITLYFCRNAAANTLSFLGHANASSQIAQFAITFYKGCEKFMVEGVVNGPETRFNLPEVLKGESVIKYKLTIHVNEAPIYLD